MKALCVRQPWAWLLFHGKDVENRDWATGYRGPLAIVASRRMTLDEYEDARDFVRLFDAGLAGRIPYPESLVYGAAVGQVIQVDCARRSGSRWFQGPFGHVYTSAEEFPVPIPVRGQLGLFEVDLAAAAAALGIQGDLFAGGGGD